MSNSKQCTVKFNKVDTGRFIFTPLEDNKRVKAQKIGYIRYKHPKKGGEITPLIQTPSITLDYYGVPRLGDYYKDDRSRSFIKIPLDTENSEEVKQFYELLKEMDEMMEERKLEFFDSEKTANKYTYQPIVRSPQVAEDSDDEDNEKEVKPDYMKAKIRINFETEEVETTVWRKNEEGSDEKRTRMEVTTIDEFAKYVRYKSTCRFTLMPSKIWAAKNQEKRYGVTFKVMHAEVEPVTGSNMREVYENDAFLDSDDEDETKATSNANAQALDGDPDDAESDADDDEDADAESEDGDGDGEEDENDDDEPEPEPEPKKTRRRKKKTANA